MADAKPDLGEWKMRLDIRLGALALAALASGCDAGPAPSPVDAGRDATVTLMDGGRVDAGPTMGHDAGTDAGTTMGDDAGFDSGAAADAGFDAGFDAGCVPVTCGPSDCGMVDDGCGGPPLDCGPCAIGAPCAADAECASGTCFTEAETAWYGGYCSERCRTDMDCGAGNHCAFTQDSLSRLGWCVRDCAGDADCRGPEYTCHNVDMNGPSECAPVGTGSGAIGDPCVSNADCGGGEAWGCLTEASGSRMGYCTLDCLVDADCGAGSHCGFIPAGGGQGVCLKDCTADADCRADGYSCYNADPDTDTAGVLECFAGGTGAGAVGAPCGGVWECGGGGSARCFSAERSDALGGYCSIVDCATDADCGTGAHCITDLFQRDDGSFIGVCAADCTTDADCRAMGYACYDINGDMAPECWIAGTGTAAVGEACTGTWDCAGGGRARCASGFVDGYCYLTGCTDGGTGATGCPTGSHCSIRSTMGVPNSTGVCVADCTTDADCRTDGYRCYDSGDVDTLTECFAAATGTGMVGSPCLVQNDCAGDEFGVCLLDFDQTTSALPDYPGGYCTLLCGMGEATCPGGTTCQFGTFCTEDCRVPLDCPRPDYTCTVPLPRYGGMMNACWPR